MDDYSIQTLRAFFLFRDLEKGEQDRLFAGLPEPVGYEKGEILFSRACFRKALGILLEGEATVRRFGDDRVILNRLSRGSAASPARVLFLTQELLSRLMREDFRIAENYIRFLSGRIRFLNERIAGFTEDSAERRVADYFFQHRREDGRVELQGSMVELAKLLGIGRTSLYRAVDALLQSGALQKEGKNYMMRPQQADACWID